MKSLLMCAVALVFLMGWVEALPGAADTLEMKDRRVIHGKYLGGTQTEVLFQVGDMFEGFAVEQVHSLTFGGGAKPSGGGPTAPLTPRQEQESVMTPDPDTANKSSPAKDSLPFFPIGLYCVEDPIDFPEIAAAGFNLVQGYRFEGSYPDQYPNTNTAAWAYLDAAQKAGLRVLMGLTVKLNSNADLNQDLRHIRERVLALRHHPALFGWQLYDEPEGADPPIPPKNLLRAYETVKQLDPVRPVSIAVAVKADETYPYHTGADILMPDYFPIGPYESGTPADIEPLIDAPIRVLKPKGKSVMVHIQAYNIAKDALVWPKEVPKSRGRYPSREEMRFMSYFSILRGATGLLFNCYWFEYEDGRGGDAISRKKNPSQWQAVSSVSTELRRMLPILQTPAQEPKKAGVTFVGKGPVETMIRQHQGKTYLFTVNPSGSPARLLIRLAPDQFPNPVITLLPAGQRIPFQTESRSFSAQWVAYDVRVYEITKTEVTDK